jgi:archaeosine-15-forming tRNA-guanine transglycosylase
MPRPTFAGGELLRAHASPSRERVVVSPDAVPFVREGRSLFARFVQRADPALAPGMSALLVDGQDELLAVGRLLLAPHEMRTLRRGVAVRVTAHRHAPSEPLDAEANDEHDPGEL